MKVTRALARGLVVLEILSSADGSAGLGVTEVAERASLDKATASRLLFTLREYGYVVQDPDSKNYSLSGKILELGHHVNDERAIILLARPYLESLRDECDETVHLGVLESSAVVYIDKLESSQSVRLVSAIGQRMPINTTALGKAILSGMDQEAVHSLLSESTLARRTTASLTNRKDLLREISLTRERGFAIDDGENEEGVTCVGAPIMGSTGRPTAAISISGPAFRTKARTGELGQLCRRTADEISSRLRTPAAPSA